MPLNSSQREALLGHLSTHEWLCLDYTAPAHDMYGKDVTLEGLNALVEEGSAEAKVMHRCACCPKCATYQCVIDEHCVQCQSANLQAIPLFHHIPCACIFEAPEGLMSVRVCRKCHQSLEANDSQVEAVGETYLCLDCGSRAPEPRLSFICLACRCAYTFDEVTFHRIWGFRLLGAASHRPSSSDEKNDG